MASKHQEKVAKSWQDKGYVVIKLSKTNHNGIADLLVAKSGEQTMLIECKEQNDTIKPLQLVQNKRIAKQAGFLFLIDKSGVGLINPDEILTKKTDLF